MFDKLFNELIISYLRCIFNSGKETLMRFEYGEYLYDMLHKGNMDTLCEIYKFYIGSECIYEEKTCSFRCCYLHGIDKRRLCW